MLYQDFLEQLQGADPQGRIQALQIFAMVQDTRALNAILQCYRQDPDPQVQAVAKWVGSHIWQAKQAGHDTLKDMQDYFQLERVDQITDAMAYTMLSGAITNNDQQEFELVQMQYEHNKLIERAAKSDTQTMHALAQDLDLLDAGLSDDFLGAIHE